MMFLAGFSGLTFSQDEVSAPDYSDEITHSDIREAENDFEFIRGRIVSIDEERNEIVIDQDQTHAKRTIAVSAERISQFNIADHVKVRVKPGGNEAEYIHKIEVWHPHPAPPQ